MLNGLNRNICISIKYSYISYMYTYICTYVYIYDIYEVLNLSESSGKDTGGVGRERYVGVEVI